MAQRRMIVTGASGLLGQQLVKLLSSAGHYVIALGRGDCPVETSACCQWRQYDLGQCPDSDFNADTIIHSAPLWLLPALLKRLAGQGALRRCIAFSSSSAESKAGAIDDADRDLANRLTAAETEIRALADDCIDCTLIRPTLIYGYGRDKNIAVIAQFIKRFGFFPVAGKANGLRQPVHVDDLAEAAVSIVDNKATFGKIYTLAGAQTLGYATMVERIFKGLNRQPRIVHLPVVLYRMLLRLRGGEYSMGAANRMNQDLDFDYSQACEDFNFQPQEFLVQPDRDLPGTQS